MTRKPAISVGLVLAVVGCATAPAIPPTQTDRVVVTTETQILRGSEGAVMSVVVKAPPAKVFTALTSIYGDLGIDVKLSDPTNGQVGNRNFVKMHRLAGEPISSYVDCGMMVTGLVADSYRVTMSLVSQVTPRDGGSNVETWLTAAARDLGTSTGDISCVSKGALETKVNQLVLQQMGG
jgi:hypothetical protein